MQGLNPLEIGVMFWAGRDPLETIREVKSLGVRCGQLGVPGNVAMDLAAAAKQGLRTAHIAQVDEFGKNTGEAGPLVPVDVSAKGFEEFAAKMVP